jgi:hypothetical protein
MQSAYNQANTGTVLAQAGYNAANNKLDLSGGVVYGNVTVNNLTANGVVISPELRSIGGTTHVYTSDIGIVSIDVAGGQTKFYNAGVEVPGDVYAGTYGGNRVSLGGNEAKLQSLRTATVQIQTGTDGTVSNTWTFNGNQLTFPDNSVQNTAFTGVGLDQFARNVANSASANTIVIQGVDLGQNTSIAATDGKMQSAYNQANTGTVLAQAGYNQSNASFLGVNTAITIIQGVDITQNTRLTVIEGTNASQNTRLDYSNSTIAIIQGVDTSQNARMTIIEGVDATQNTNIANKLSLTGAPNQTVTGNVTISQDLIIAGNLIITGNIASQNVQQLAVADPLIILGIGNYVSDTKDIGFASHYNDGTNAHAGIIRDSETKEFYVFQGYVPELDSNNNVIITDSSFRTANFNANYVKGNLIATTAVVNGIDLSAYTQATYTQANVTVGVDATQNTRLTVIEGTDASQNARLNYSNSTIAIIQGVDTSQNARMTIIEGVDVGQNNAIIALQSSLITINSNSAYSSAIDNSQNNRMAIIEGTDLSQNVRIDYSNTTITIIQGVNLGQNTAIAATDGKMQSAFNKANTGTSGGSSSGYLANSVIFANTTGYLSNTANILFFAANNNLFVSGNVGIGTTSPAGKLEVVGNVNDPYSGTVKTTNSNVGAAVQTGLLISNGTQSTQFTLAGTGYGGYGAYTAGNALVYNQQAVTIMADQASTGIIKFATGGNAERMRIDTSGNLGIGTSSPGAKLHVYGANFPLARIERVTSVVNSIRSTFSAIHTTTGDMVDGFGSDISFGIRDSAGVDNEIANFGAIRDGADNSGALVFSTVNAGVGQGVTKMILKADGNLGIGTTTPANKFQTTMSSGAGSPYIGINQVSDNPYIEFQRWSGGGVAYAGARIKTTNEPSIIFENSNTANIGSQAFTERMRINSSGQVGIGTTSLQTILDTKGGASYFGGNFTTLAEAYGPNSISAKGAYDLAGTVVTIGSLANAVNAGALINFNAYNSANGATGAFCGAVAGATGNGPANFVIGRRTATQAWAESLRVDTAGNVGIGTNAPTGKLDVVGSGGTVRVESGGDSIAFTKNGLNYLSAKGGSSGAFVFETGGAVERMRLDSSGNLGLGVTPSAWAGLASYRSIELGTSVGTGVLGGPNDLQSFANAYYATGWKYAGTGLASSYKQGSGIHSWYNAPSGTAGNAITFTQAMTLHASGGLSLGNTTDPGATNLSVTGTIASASTVTGTRLISTVATGTAPLTVTSTTAVANLSIGGTAATATSAGNLTGGTISGNYTVGQATSPNTYYKLFGDNTGWTYRYMTSVSGTPTTRHSWTDTGNYTAVGSVTASSFSGAGTGLTGTASSLSIGGTAGSETLTTVTGRGATTATAVNFTNTMTIGGTDVRGVLTVQKDFTSTFASNTDPTDAGRPFVMQNNSATLAANQYSNITLQIAPSASLPGGRILGDLRLVRESISSTNSFFMLSAFRQDGTYKDFFKIGYDSSYHIGNLNVGYTADQGYKLAVNGSFAATTKSFLIPHPTKEGMKLRYGSLEGPENGVYIRGKLTNNNTIELPEYWTKLVDPDSITVNLTPIGKHQNLFVESVENNKVVVGNSNLMNKNVNCYFTVFAERVDVDKLVVEID